MPESPADQFLNSLGFDAWNAMQLTAHLAIPAAGDLLLLAPTGSGKTAAFLPPLPQLLTPQTGVQVLVLTPSRELALQTEQVWRKMNTGRRVAAFYGGRNLATDTGRLQEPPALVVGTPGRITDHIARHTFQTDQIETVVLDEFDKLLSLGFEEELSYILRSLPNLRRRVLVSATNMDKIPAFIGIAQPTILNFTDREHAVEDNSRRHIKLVHSTAKDKIDTLVQLLCHIGTESALIFCNHREAIERTSGMLREHGIVCAAFHGGMDQESRERTLAQFRNGSVQFLVSTDLAGRGLDIPDVSHVIHYHLPHTEQDFIHRNGRTARMFADGTVWLILHSEEKRPDYLPDQVENETLKTGDVVPEAPPWITIRINGGKRNKISKGDIAGFFIKKGGLEKDQIGMIEIKDQCAYAAVSKNRARALLTRLHQEKMKGKTYKFIIINDK